MRIIITGDRDFLDYERLEKIMLQIMEKYPDETVEIVAGGDKGAESIGELFALKHYLKVARFPANWRRYGSSAGYIRNSDMIDYARQEKGILIAFWDGKVEGRKIWFSWQNVGDLKLWYIQQKYNKDKGDRR